MTTEADIRNLLQTSNEALLKALLVIYARQTSHEQAVQDSRLTNNRGFSAAHAPRLSYFAELYIKTGWLSDPKIEIARQWLPHYTDQLLEEVRLKAAGRPTPLPRVNPNPTFVKTAQPDIRKPKVVQKEQQAARRANRRQQNRRPVFDNQPGSQYRHPTPPPAAAGMASLDRWTLRLMALEND